MVNFAQNTKQRVVLINNINLTESNKSDFIKLSQNYKNVIFLTTFNSNQDIQNLSNKEEVTDINNIYINGEEYVKVRGVSTLHNQVTLTDGTIIQLTLSDTGFLCLDTINNNPYFGVFYEFDNTLSNYQNYNSGIFISLSKFLNFADRNDIFNLSEQQFRLGDKDYNTYILIHNSYLYTNYPTDDNENISNWGEFKDIKIIDSNIILDNTQDNTLDSKVFLEIPKIRIQNKFELNQSIFNNLTIRNKYYSIYKIDKQYCGQFSIKFDESIFNNIYNNSRQ